MKEENFEPESLSMEEANYAGIEPELRMAVTQVGGFPEEDSHTLEERAPGSDVGQDLLLEDAERADTWLNYHKGFQQTGYTPADMITRDNVDSLSREYEIEYDTNGMEVNPTIVPSDPPVMYITTSNGTIEAVNARNGDRYWRYRWSPRPAQTWTKNHNRGVGIWQDKVYYTTEDNTILALNRYTGERITDFGGQGEVRDGEADLLWTEDTKYPQMLYWIYQSQKPMLYDGTIFIGQSNDVIWGSLHAVDAETGERLWDKMAVAPDGWVGDSWVHGACASWMTPAVDPDTDTVVFPIGDPSSFFNTMVRPGPNKHSLSLFAIDAKSFETKWVHQVLPQENWDYDLSGSPLIIEEEIDGETRKVVAMDWKAGWTYVVDLETGQLIRRSDPWGKQMEHRFSAWPDSKFLNRVPFGEENKGEMFPALTGASEWPPDAYSPQTGLKYIGVGDSGHYTWGDKDWSWEHGKIKPDNPDDNAGDIEMLEDYDHTAWVRAFDFQTGQVQWEYQFEDVNDMPLLWPGGSTATAGNLLFSGSPGGDFVALDAEIGDELWKDDTGSRITAAPVVWQDSQRQQEYVAIASNDRVIVYSTSSSG